MVSVCQTAMSRSKDFYDEYTSRMSFHADIFTRFTTSLIQAVCHTDLLIYQLLYIYNQFFYKYINNTGVVIRHAIICYSSLEETTTLTTTLSKILYYTLK